MRRISITLMTVLVMVVILAATLAPAFAKKGPSVGQAVCNEVGLVNLQVQAVPVDSCTNDIGLANVL